MMEDLAHLWTNSVLTMVTAISSLTSKVPTCNVRQVPHTTGIIVTSAVRTSVKLVVAAHLRAPKVKLTMTRKFDSVATWPPHPPTYPTTPTILLGTPSQFNYMLLGRKVIRRGLSPGRVTLSSRTLIAPSW